MAFQSGKDGRVLVSGTGLPITQWSATLTCEKLDVTNAEGNGYAEFIGGILQGDVSFTALVDAASLLNVAPGIYEGTNLTVQLHISNSGSFITGTLFTESCGWSSAVRGQPCMVAISGSFTGTYTRPS